MCQLTYQSPRQRQFNITLDLIRRELIDTVEYKGLYDLTCWQYPDLVMADGYVVDLFWDKFNPAYDLMVAMIFGGWFLPTYSD